MQERRKPAASQERISGVRLGVLHMVMIAVALAVSVVLLVATARTFEGYETLERATNHFFACQEDAQAFQAGSDYLTNEARYFMMTGDAAHAHNFIDEVEKTRRREAAVEDLGELVGEETAYQLLLEALDYSNALIEVECYAMRLNAEAIGLEVSALPTRMGGIDLTEEDAALTSAQQREKAVEMLYGVEYLNTKDNIRSRVENSVDALVDITHRQQIDSSQRLSRLLRHQRVLIVALLVLLFAVVLCTYWLVIKPIRRSVVLIRGGQRIPVEGAYEMRFLASTYNDIFDKHNRSTQELTYFATHDSLTGLYNRSAYDAKREHLDGSDIGVLIIDVDEFKKYNDTYGHDVGDKVLQKVARVLQDSFRSEDFISRIGGDEFCVMMVSVSSDMRETVEQKIRLANARLQHPDDGMPSISISVVVAFSDRLAVGEDLFKAADGALYAVKRQGRASCAFH